MTIDVSDFELAMLTALLLVSIVTTLGMTIAFKVRDRFSPVGRLVSHRVWAR